MDLQLYAPKILLVEDLPQFSTPIIRWLSEEGYRVRLATSYQEAHLALDMEHFHLAIIDVRLTDNDVTDESGLLLLEDMKHMDLIGTMPCIVLTAYADKERILRAWQTLSVSRLIEKDTNYRQKLLTAVEELFVKEVKIKFDLIYVGESDRVFKEVAKDINWSMSKGPPISLLQPQVQDLFGKLFVDAKSVYLSKLNPGLTGAAVVRVQPTYANGGMGRSYVVKVGRRDKVKTESDRYREYVTRFLPANTVGHMGVAYSRQIGALLYTFAENEMTTLQEFDEYYKKATVAEILLSLEGLFQNTCYKWYDGRQRDIEDLAKLYYEAFQLDEKKLVGRIQTVLPQFDPTAETFQFRASSTPVLNPIAWLNKYRDECVLPVYQCITHGDLTGRNIMVDESGKCWLIDFYRTYPSHILRDFVILETDIKYRLLPGMSVIDFLKLEEALLEADRTETPPVLALDMPGTARKAAAVIYGLRQLARKFAQPLQGQPDEVRKEHLISLLMATLNVARLRHIDETRKEQALHSAVLICSELDRIAGRAASPAAFSAQMEPYMETAFYSPDDSGFFPPALSFATRQQRFLADKLLTKDVVLFIGTADPRDPTGKSWPNAADLAEELRQEMDAPADEPTRLFAHYANKAGGRERLIEKHVDYYQRMPRPIFFRKVVKINWTAVYTTNQHTYLADAYQAKEIPYTLCFSLPEPEVSSPPEDGVPIYKIYGSLDKVHRHDPPSILPISDFEYSQWSTKMRVQQLWQQLGQVLKQGRDVLMVCATKEELMGVYGQYEPREGAGLLWASSHDFTEEDQDYYRNLNLRVLPDHPSNLMTVLYTLLSGGDFDFETQ